MGENLKVVLAANAFFGLNNLNPKGCLHSLAFRKILLMICEDFDSFLPWKKVPQNFSPQRKIQI
jgi:hypothetical protein